MIGLPTLKRLFDLLKRQLKAFFVGTGDPERMSLKAAAKSKIFARSFSHSDLPVRDVLHRVKSPLETDAGQEFELLPPAAVSGGDA